MLRDPEHGPLDWRHPLVLDQIRHFYSSRLRCPPERLREITLLHFRLWRHVFEGEQREATLFRAALGRKLMEAGESEAIIDRADQAVLDELMDVIRARFRRAPNTARAHSIALLESATVLVRSRQTAA